MKIIFVGQKGFLGRVEALAVQLAKRGHEVIVVGNSRNLPSNMHTFQGVSLIRSRVAWLRVWFSRPAAVHISGWQWAAATAWLRWLLPETILVWTIETLPGATSPLRTFWIRQAAAAADSVTVTTRAAQWRLLSQTGIRALYIPDGFNPDYGSLPSIRRWKLWRGRYGVTSAVTREELAWVAEAWQKSGTRKKLVVVSQVSQITESFFKRTYPFLIFRAGGSRVRQALLAGAQVVITPSGQDDSRLLLSAMAAARPIISTTHSLHEELYGTTVEYVREGDEQALTKLIRILGRQPETETVSAAAKRAVRFFHWERIFLEYLPLYAQLREIVPLDSAQAVTFSKPAVQ